MSIIRMRLSYPKYLKVLTSLIVFLSTIIFAVIGLTPGSLVLFEALFKLYLLTLWPNL